MKRAGLILFLLAIVSGVSAGVASADSLQIDRKACQFLTAHRPLPNVDYQADVDVHGNAVVSADLTPSLQFDVGAITLPLTVDLAEQLGLPLGLLEGSRATVALVTVDGDQAYLNGAPISQEQEDNLAVLCLEANE